MQLSYCGEQVRRHDNDRYLTALLAPSGRREALFSLYAFNIEVAKTREAVSEPMVGQIRLQWWRDAIDTIYAGKPPDHVVIDRLAEAIEDHGLSRAYFDTLINAREFDLDETPPATLDDLIRYVKGTSSTLVRLAVEILDGADSSADEAAIDVGVAWGLTGLLRSLVFHARARRQYLPADLMTKSGAVVSDLFELRASAALAQVAEEIAEAATHSIYTARSRRTGVPGAARPALFQATLAEMYLQRIRRARYDLFARPVVISQPARQLRLLRASLFGRY